VGAGKKYYGRDIGVTVDNYATAFPDMHRDFISLYTADDVVVVELTLNGTHKGDLRGGSTISVGAMSGISA
jgi:predicted ester cyclase